MTLSYKLKVFLAKNLLRVLYRRGKYRTEGEDLVEKYHKDGRSFIISMWHGQLLTMFMRHAFKNSVAMAGTHKDASLIADIGSKMNWRFVRGSSSEYGASALKAMVRELKKPGTIFFITPDGPKGPSRIAKLGVIKAAQLANVPIFPSAGQATRRWGFKNWDTFFVAKPFSKIYLDFGEPLQVGKNDDPKIALQTLQNELNTLSENVERKSSGK